MAALPPPTLPTPLSEPTRAPFPQDPESFDADDRISFSKLSSKFLLEAEDGSEFEYDDVLKRWVPVLDESLLEQQREAYKIQGVNEEEEVVPANVKRKREREQKKEEGYVNGVEEGGRLVKKSKPEKEPKERKNTAVYVTGLPDDATVEEVQDVFKKWGIIAEEIDSGRPRIKLYTDEQGNFKGDALVVYFRAESVSLAVQMLHDTDFRFGQASPAGNMSVVAADFSYKKQGGTGDMAERPKPSGKDKKKIIKRTQKLNR